MARKAKRENKVWVRVRPYRGIGGVGGPGTVAEMDAEMAEMYVRMGYVDVIEAPEPDQADESPEPDQADDDAPEADSE